MLENQIKELRNEVKKNKEKIIIQEIKIKQLQNKINCLELDEVIKINEKY